MSLKQSAPKQDINGVTRRSFFRTIIGAGFIGSTLLGGYSFAIEPYWYRRKSYTLRSPKWPKRAKPLRLAIASDLHVGCPSVNLETLRRIVQSLNAMEADAILLLGDFLISGVKGGRYVPPQEIGPVLEDLRAPMGVYAVLGNHDWWEDGQGMWDALKTAGVKVLENDALPAVTPMGDRLWFAGLADDTTRTPDLAQTLRAVTTDEPVIMLSHDPATFMTMNDRPVVTLCGHTHGGQIALPFWGPLVIPGRAPIKYAYGHIHEGGRDMIVSCGIGTSILPVRLNRRPELVDLTITSTDS